ncbi:hypothetical protein FUA23_12295 [Neolewinella aurantiaca]|uniref:Uncharacterized protein n=1 Tax=Neolewinella aurantiaca TaxID=2602767 RepID=A0A5C7FW37_9BACT|nr:hypothetical protein [Neolewinella aurantiaca]TXF89060.1 hypothetical protein FUA23_12295 [Neolewinella aurantiaca]
MCCQISSGTSLSVRMEDWCKPSMLFLLLLLSAFGNPLKAENITGSAFTGYSKAVPEFLLSEQTALQEVYRKHRFVALPAPALLSPDPFQLRVQDLRNIECYAQPDALEVCGAGDTIPIMLFTKSVSPLQDIRLDVIFEDGIEYGGFAYVDNTLSNSGAQLDTISTENPESPSFLLDQVSEATGGVIVYLGVRAECGVDFSINNPDVTFNFSYTNADGVACTGSVTLEDYGGNVLIPQVVITNVPASTNLGRFNEDACQTIDISQATIDASASGYIFTAGNYGFEEGITISMVNVEGVPADPTTYTIDPATGALELTVTNATADGLLDFNETTSVEICYTYGACIPNIDYFPNYTVIDACEGEVCSGPLDERASTLVTNFPQRPRFTAEFLNEQQPDVCAGDPYSFDIVIGTGGMDELDDQMTDVFFDVRRCKIPGLSISEVQLISDDGSTVLGTVDESLVTTRQTDELDSDDNPTANRAGTVRVDLRRNAVDLSAAGLIDLDGDGNFDDLAGNNSIRFRFIFPVSCSDEELGGCNTAPNAGGSGPVDCQFNEIGIRGRRACNSGAVSTVVPFNEATEFTAASSSSFSNAGTFNYGGATFSGYDFGTTGLTPTLVEGRQNLNFEYLLSDADLFQCPTNVGTATLTLKVSGSEFLTNDFTYENVLFDGAPSGMVTVDNSEDGMTTVTIEGGSVTANTPFSFNFDMASDTAECSPPQLIFMDAYLTTECASGCDCAPVRTCSSTTLIIDPDSLDCDCTYSVFHETERVSRGFADNTRTDEVDFSTVSRDDSLRYVSGDIIRVRQKVVIDRNRLPDWNEADDILYFQMFMRSDAGNNSPAQMPAMLDIYLAQVETFQLIRPSTNETIDIAAAFSGNGGTDILNNTGLTVGVGGSNSVNSDFTFFSGEGGQPAFPDGGYTFGLQNSSSDGIDGRYLSIQLSNQLSTGVNGVGTFFDAIGGSLQLGDTIEIEITVPLVDNPGWDGVTNSIFFDGSVTAFQFIGDPTANNSLNISAGACISNATRAFYQSPEVVAESRIEYTDDCEAELVVRFEAGNIPDTWFTNEYRLVAGIEQFGVDIPFPYYYDGGATVETGGLAPMPVEPDSTSGLDTATILGTTSVIPDGVFGTLYFRDAEFLDGVRPDGYAGYYSQGIDDITTVGGTFPLLGFQGGADDSLVFRIPLTRVCGALPTTGLTMDFDAANLHLPDLEMRGYVINNNFWDGMIRGNEGQTVVPIPLPEGTSSDAYLPFERLGGVVGSTTDPVSLERQINNPLVPVVPNGLPAELSGTTTIANADLTDGAGTETNDFMLCPQAGEALAAGALSIEVANSVSLVSISGGATVFNTALITDTSTFYAVEIPAGLAIDECFSLTIETDLIFCDEGFVCLNAALGCADSQVPVENQIAALAEFMLDCGDLRVCYEYRAGNADLETSFNTPMQSGLCTEQTYSVTYRNTGNGDLQDFMPLLFLPSGFEFTPGSFMITLVGGGTAGLTDPAAQPGSNNVYGEAYVFDQAEINAFLTNMVVEPRDIVTISFNASTTCDFIDGSSIASAINANNECNEPFGSDLTASAAIRVSDPGAPSPSFELDLPDNVEVSCGADGTDIVITALNLGKAPAGGTTVMLTLPSGFSLNENNVEVLVPADYVITADSITATPLGGGVTMYSFNAPPSVGVGGTFCLSVNVVIDDLECGDYPIGIAFKQTLELLCQATGEFCMVESIINEGPVVNATVVPAVTISGESEVTASCGATMGTFDINYTFGVAALSQDFSGPVTVDLFSDVDGNGEVDPAIDMMLGSANMANVTVAAGETSMISGAFSGIDQADVCPVLIRLQAAGCACGESVLSVEDILPDFVSDLGESIALCPGETGMLEGICADLNYNFIPATDGMVVDNMDGTVSFTLADGVLSSTLKVSGNFGACPIDIDIPVETVEEFSFGPYEATVCNEGAQEIDFNIPPALQEDLEILILPSIGLDDPTSFEPTISDLQADQVYTVQFTLNGECTAETTLTVTVDQAPTVELTGATTCITGFDLQAALSISPADLTGEFQTSGDGTFTTGNRVPGATEYIPGPLDREAGQVSFRFISDDPEGPCGPDVARMDFTILLVDCGSFMWDGSNR